ncbi:MAG: hypothetical protein KIT08_03120 [Anaerolineales bacterium]|nr:MAG: hypothetical protein KIT08_03120 [Anaerolineales bacterium]
MLDLKLLLIHSLVGIVAISGIILTVGVKRPRWFLVKKNVPPDILAAVPPRTEAERRQSLWAGIPLALGLLSLVLYSTFVFGRESGAGFGLLFLHALILILAVSTFDLVVIDWLLLNTITPKQFVYPGTEGFAGYKAYGFHGRAHLRALPGQAVFAAMAAGIVMLLT